MGASRMAELFRQHVAGVRMADEAGAVEDICAALNRCASPERECEPLDRVLASSDVAAIARIALALQPEAAELSRDVAAIRRERKLAAQPWRRHVRSVVAMAAVAGLAAMAVMVSGVNHPVATPQPAAPMAHQGKAAPEDVIRSISFEGDGVASVSEEDTGRIFQGDFDS